MDVSEVQAVGRGRWGLEAAFALALLHFAIVTATLLLARPEGSLAWFWPANAVAVAFMVCCPRHLLAPAGLLSFLSSALANLLYGDGFWFAVGINVANLMEVALLTLAVRWFAGSPVPRLTVRLYAAIAAAIIPAAGMAGIVGAVIVSHSFGTDPMVAWRRWLLGDVISMLAVLPLALVAVRGGLAGVLERYLPRGLRARLALVWLLALIPLVTLAYARLQAERATAVKAAQDHALDLSRAANQRFNHALREAELTARFALTLEEALTPGPACQESMAELAAASSGTLGLHMARPDGTLYCSSFDPLPEARFGDRDYFREAVSTRAPTVSGYVIGRASGTPVIVVAWPKLAADGTVAAVALPAVPLSQLTAIATDLVEPTNGLAVTVLDRDARVLVRYPEGESWTGRVLATSPMAQTTLPGGEALYDMTGNDGLRRVGAWTTMAGGGLLAVSYRHDMVVEQAVTGFLRGLASLVVVLTGALGALWFLLDRLALRGLGQLEAVAADIRDGRPPCPERVEGAEEIRALARALADMAATVATREELLVEARAQAERANRVKSGFLSAMSHELRTPLNAILGFGQMLELGMAGPLAPKQAEYLRDITMSATNLLALIEDLFDLGDIESGRLRVELGPVPLAALVGDLCATLAPQAAAANVAVACQVPHGLVARADTRRLTQVVANLITNAIKYNRPDGRVEVAGAAREGRVRLTVRDTGLGIPPGREREVFEPSNRLGREATAIPGTGLGLAISQRLVRMMGGDIGFAPAEGGGTLFWVELAGTGAPDADPLPRPAEAVTVC